MTESSFFLDTNVLIRFFAEDSPEQATQARSMIAALEEGSIYADTADTVIFECVYVMTKQYRMTREFTLDALRAILVLDSVRVSAKSALLEALDLWGKVRRISFADAYHLILASHTPHKRIATFDKGMGNVLPGVSRIEQLP